MRNICTENDITDKQNIWSDVFTENAKNSFNQTSDDDLYMCDS